MSPIDSQFQEAMNWLDEEFNRAVGASTWTHLGEPVAEVVAEPDPDTIRIHGNLFLDPVPAKAAEQELVAGYEKLMQDPEYLAEEQQRKTLRMAPIQPTPVEPNWPAADYLKPGAKIYTLAELHASDEQGYARGYKDGMGKADDHYWDGYDEGRRHEYRLWDGTDGLEGVSFVNLDG